MKIHGICSEFFAETLKGFVKPPSRRRNQSSFGRYINRCGHQGPVRRVKYSTSSEARAPVTDQEVDFFCIKYRKMALMRMPSKIFDTRCVPARIGGPYGTSRILMRHMPVPVSWEGHCPGLKPIFWRRDAAEAAKYGVKPSVIIFVVAFVCLLVETNSYI